MRGPILTRKFERSGWKIAQLTCSGQGGCRRVEPKSTADFLSDAFAPARFCLPATERYVNIARPPNLGRSMAMPEGQRARPQPTPETMHFWEGTRAGELRLQRCDSCGKTYFPPRPFCPACASREVSVFRASGKGRLYSYVIHHRPVPGFTPPYAIAVVELDEGPRLMTNIVGCPQTPEALVLDMPLEIAFEKIDDEITLPLFRPAKG
jgi:uncharacterized protein